MQIKLLKKYLSNEIIVCRNVDKIIPITRQIQKKVMKLTKITDMNKYFIDSMLRVAIHSIPYSSNILH